MKNRIKKNQNGSMFLGKAGLLEKIAFVCNSFILLVFIYDLVFQSLNMWLIIIPLSLIEFYFILYFLFPEKYIFKENALEIHYIFGITSNIYYSSIFNMDSKLKDSFVNITENNVIKLYYEENGKKKVVKCMPNDAETFIEKIKENCDIFREEIKNASSDIEKLL